MIWEIHKLTVTFPKFILPIHCTSSFVSLKREKIVLFRIIWLVFTGVGDCIVYNSSSCADCANLKLILSVSVLCVNYISQYFGTSLKEVVGLCFVMYCPALVTHG
jgi:hypothetical protein